HQLSRVEGHDQAQHEETDGDVQAVQPHQRVVGRSEQIGPNREPLYLDEPTPLARGAVKERHAQRDGHKPEGTEPFELTEAKRSYRQVDRYAARKQTDSKED